MIRKREKERKKGKTKTTVHREETTVFASVQVWSREVRSGKLSVLTRTSMIDGMVVGTTTDQKGNEKKKKYTHT